MDVNVNNFIVSTTHLDEANVETRKYAVIQNYAWGNEWGVSPQLNEMFDWSNWWFQNGRNDKAIEVLTATRNENPGHPLVLFLLGTILLLDSQEQMAITELLGSIDLYNRFPEAHNNLGVAYELLGNEEEALESYLNGIHVIEKHVLKGSVGKTYVNAARIYSRMGDNQTAVSMYDAATNTFANDSNGYWFARGMSFFLQGHIDQARSSIIEALKKPDNAYPVPPNILTNDDLDLLRTSRFSVIYEKKYWGSPYASGPGSSPQNTAILRGQLGGILHDYEISSVLDIGCGDWTWIPLTNLSGIDYTGVDIVPQLINDNKVQAMKLLSQNLPTSPRSVEFYVVDAVKDPLPQPPRDLLFCREVIIHLPVKDILNFLKILSQSGSKYLLLDSDPTIQVNNDTSRTFFTLPGTGWRTVNLLIEPFNLPQPLATFDRGACLWKLPLPGY